MMTETTQDTLYLIVTCCREPTRFAILQNVVQNFKDQFPDSFQNDLIVFDNASNDETCQLLTDTFRNVWRSEQNVGLWNAIYWTLQNYERVLGRTYKFIHIMESDHCYFHADGLVDCENVLEQTDYGAIKCHEYSVKNKHLYDKDQQQVGSHTDCWIRHRNVVTDKPVELIRLMTNSNVYVTNFLVNLHNVLRIDSMKTVFNALRTAKNFDEQQFQREFHKLHPQILLLDGGVFNMTFGDKHVLKQTMMGSGNNGEAFSKAGYVETAVRLQLSDDVKAVKLSEKELHDGCSKG